MFGGKINIENTCETCPLRKILDCDSARVIEDSFGTSFKLGGYVTHRFLDNESRQAEIRVTHPAKTNHIGTKLYSNSYMDSQAVEVVNNNIESCEEPSQKGMLRRDHCLTGMDFRQIGRRELKADEENKKRASQYSAYVMTEPLFKTKFRTKV